MSVNSDNLVDTPPYEPPTDPTLELRTDLVSKEQSLEHLQKLALQISHRDSIPGEDPGRTLQQTLAR